MTPQATLQKPLTFREYIPTDFAGVQTLWRNEAGWGELTEKMFREWYIDIPDGPAILVVAAEEDGTIAGLITMTPHRVALGEREVKGARIAANIVSSERQMAKFDFLTHPLAGMLLECRNAAYRREMTVLFGLPKVNWMNLLRMAEKLGVAFIQHTRIDCYERGVAGPSLPANGMVATPIGAFSQAHEEVWNTARRTLGIGSAIHRDLATLRFRNGGHRNFDLSNASGELIGFASVRDDGLLFDIVVAEKGRHEDALAALFEALEGSDIPTLKVMQASYYRDLEALGFTKSSYQFGFVSDVLETELWDELAPRSWYLAGGG